jgi:lysozyme family protein
MAKFEEALQILLKHEGGYVDHENDPGGATKFGISLRYLKDQNIIDGDLDRDGDIDEEDIKLLTTSHASSIYKKAFWDINRLDNIKYQRLANMIFGFAVNSGNKQAVKLLQRAFNDLVNQDKELFNKARCGQFIPRLSEDGNLGPLTIASINDTYSETDLINSYKDRMKLFYSVIAARNKKLKVFLKGWLNRVNSY